MMAEILKKDAGDTNKPILLISCFGGAKYFKMNHKLEKDFMDAIGEMAATKGKFISFIITFIILKILSMSI